MELAQVFTGDLSQRAPSKLCYNNSDKLRGACSDVWVILRCLIRCVRIISDCAVIPTKIRMRCTCRKSSAARWTFRGANDPHDGRVGRKIRNIASRLRCLLIRILVVNCNYIYICAIATPIIGDNRSEMKLSELLIIDSRERWTEHAAPLMPKKSCVLLLIPSRELLWKFNRASFRSMSLPTFGFEFNSMAP